MSHFMSEQPGVVVQHVLHPSCPALGDRILEFRARESGPLKRECCAFLGCPRVPTVDECGRVRGAGQFDDPRRYLQRHVPACPELSGRGIQIRLGRAVGDTERRHPARHWSAEVVLETLRGAADRGDDIVAPHRVVGEDHDALAREHAVVFGSRDRGALGTGELALEGREE